MNKESERVKYLLQNWSHLQLAREYEKLENIIKEVRELLSKYNDKESNYYVPVDTVLEILNKVEVVEK